MIDIKEITELLNSKDYSLELKFQNAMTNSKITNELDIKSCSSTEELASRVKRQLSLETQTKTIQTKGKLTRTEEYYSEPMEIIESNSAKQIHSNTSLIQD